MSKILDFLENNEAGKTYEQFSGSGSEVTPYHLLRNDSVRDSFKDLDQSIADFKKKVNRFIAVREIKAACKKLGKK